MIFTTYWFILFCVCVLPIYWLLPRAAWRLYFLAAVCAVFHYHFAGPAGVVPILVLGVLTYVAGRSRRRWACLAVMLLCVLALCFYKYALFVLGQLVHPVAPVLAAQLATQTQGILPGAPPLGISFFAFEFVHYLFDVRRGSEPIRHPVKFAVFAIFFPSLVAGPIKRYQQFLPALDAGCTRVPLVDLAEGCQRIGLGFLKKMVVADNLTAWIELAQGDFAASGLMGRWLLVLAIALRILMDFSGYSDMAIGFGRLLGVALPENFNWPYFARNLQDFWQRWHISLSSWIRDYIYIPLGGSRHGVVRRILNGLIAFGLCGLWHGAAWNFVVWGLYHGTGLALCATYEKIPGAGPALAGIFRREPLAGWLLTQVFVALGWLLFFYPLPAAWLMIKGCFTL